MGASGLVSESESEAGSRGAVGGDGVDNEVEGTVELIG